MMSLLFVLALKEAVKYNLKTLLIDNQFIAQYIFSLPPYPIKR